MCDIKSMKNLQRYKTLQPEEALQLVLEAGTEEQRSFYEMVGNFLPQRKKRQVIEWNLSQPTSSRRPV